MPRPEPDHECGTLDLECCAKSRIRNMKAMEAIVSAWGDEEDESG